MARRQDGIDELFDMADDIKGIEQSVKKLGFLSRRVFKKQLRTCEVQLGRDFLNLIYENVHQSYNHAYEKALDFNKNKKWHQYFSVVYDEI